MPRPRSCASAMLSSTNISACDMISFANFLIQTLNGIVSGMILALVASGLTLIFGIMEVVNFAHGEFLMLGAYVGVITLVATGNFWLALIVAALAIAIFGALVYLTTLRPLLGRDPLTTILATFGISLVLQNYALWQFGPVARKIQEPFTGHFTLFYLEYPWYRLVIALLSAGIIGALWLFLKFGTYGIWIRATTQDRVMAQAMGIPVPRVLTAVFAIGSGMAAASGVLFGPLVGVNHAMGLDWVLKAFIVVVVGGMGNLGGSIAASIFISLLESYASLWVSPAQAVIFSFVVLILALLFGVIAAAGVAAFVAYFSTRLRDIYFAITTLIFSQIFYVIIFTWTEVTGGENGLTFSRPPLAVPGLFSVPFTSRTLHWFVLAVVTLSYLVLRRITRSPFGMVLQSIRENEARTRAIGYPIERYKIVAVMLSGLFAGLAGGLYAIQNRFAAPDFVFFLVSGEVIIFNVMGGIGTLVGPIVGAAFFLLLREGRSRFFTEYYLIPVGVIFVAMVS